MPQDIKGNNVVHQRKPIYKTSPKNKFNFPIDRRNDLSNDRVISVAWMAELADALDSKSSSFTRVRVRPPLQVPVMAVPPIACFLR